MKFVEFLQKNKHLSITELREKLLDISKVELVEMLLETTQKEPEQPIKHPITQDVYDTLVKLIDDNFRVISANGRGRKSAFDEMSYADAVKKILQQDDKPVSYRNHLLNRLYRRELTIRVGNGEDVTNFKPTQINRGTIINPIE
jgi:GTP-sensing pleiotropic transcriptional regulator CodY